MHKNARNIHTESASAWHLAAVFARKVPSDFSRIKKFTHCSGMAPFVSNAGQQGSRSSSEPMQLSHIRGTCLPFMTDKSDTLKHDHLHMYAHACVLSRAHTHTHTEEKEEKFNDNEMYIFTSAIFHKITFLCSVGNSKNGK